MGGLLISRSSSQPYHSRLMTSIDAQHLLPGSFSARSIGLTIAHLQKTPSRGDASNNLKPPRMILHMGEFLHPLPAAALRREPDQAIMVYQRSLFRLPNLPAAECGSSIPEG